MHHAKPTAELLRLSAQARQATDISRSSSAWRLLFDSKPAEPVDVDGASSKEESEEGLGGPTAPPPVSGSDHSGHQGLEPLEHTGVLVRTDRNECGACFIDGRLFVVAASVVAFSLLPIGPLGKHRKAMALQLREIG
jgi:hypothetical protein